jgi:hypothetical protein
MPLGVGGAAAWNARGAVEGGTGTGVGPGMRSAATMVGKSRVGTPRGIESGIVGSGGFGKGRSHGLAAWDGPSSRTTTVSVAPGSIPCSAPCSASISLMMSASTVGEGKRSWDAPELRDDGGDGGMSDESAIRTCASATSSVTTSGTSITMPPSSRSTERRTPEIFL